MFTNIPYRYGSPPNTLTNEVVLALPGTLPVINRAAVCKTVQMGLVFNCEIASFTKWDRKNYFYPDLPKNYQISQYDHPLCRGGNVEIELPGPARNVQGEHRHVALNRIHLEEDAGKLTHCDDESLVDFNRAGTPLVEIVSEPDLHSSQEVFAYLKSLIVHLQYLGASHCDMEKGQLRCDANVSIRPMGSVTFGTKVELKNLNSISGVCGGIEHEMRRQIAILESGGTVVQETRRWDAERGVSTSMRGKEDAHDYRYFPDPDLPPLHLSADFVDSLRRELPELPFAKQRRYAEQYRLPYTVTSVLCPNKDLADFFETALAENDDNPLAIANWIANDLIREISAGERGEADLSAVKIRPPHLAQLVRLTDLGVLSKQSAKEVFVEMFRTGDPPGPIVDRKGLRMTRDAGALEEVCRSVIGAFPQPAAEFKAGKDKAINVLKGQVMQRLSGRAPPSDVDATLRALLQ
jgi:aspartyl-tRNA(Asn)/glutamyl-tRNA(Gln) amidotransferase subunit B